MSDPHLHSSDVHENGHLEWSSLNQWILWLGLAAAVIWLRLLHNAHLLELLPFLIVLTCPLLRLFTPSKTRASS